VCVYVKRDLQIRPTKQTCKRDHKTDLQTRSTKDMKDPWRGYANTSSAIFLYIDILYIYIIFLGCFPHFLSCFLSYVYVTHVYITNMHNFPRLFSLFLYTSVIYIQFCLAVFLSSSAVFSHIHTYYICTLIYISIHIIYAHNFPRLF